MKSPSLLALKDISDHLKNDESIRKNEYNGLGWDVYVVSQELLQTKETTKLNKELGLYSINKIGNTNGKK